MICKRFRYRLVREISRGIFISIFLERKGFYYSVFCGDGEKGVEDMGYWLVLC